MHVLVAGAGGMLGSAIRRTAPPDAHLASLTHGDCDITDKEAVSSAVGQYRPDWIINCAAYTAVDRAEAEPARAYLVNAVGAVHLATAAQRHGIPLVHLSTDYVFEGSGTTPLAEDASPHPVNVYGWSKLAGEQAVRDILPHAHLIVRTQWLFGLGGANFVTTVLRTAKERSHLRVVNDQYGRPTYAMDLASAIWVLLARPTVGTVHVANAGMTTWFAFAGAVMELAGIRTPVDPCATSDVPRPARRPAFSVLDCGRYESITGQSLPEWRDALARYLGDHTGSPEPRMTMDAER